MFLVCPNLLPVTESNGKVSFTYKPRSDVNVHLTTFTYVCDEGYFVVNLPDGMRSCEKLNDDSNLDGLGTEYICGEYDYLCASDGSWEYVERESCIQSKSNVFVEIKRDLINVPNSITYFLSS